MGSVVSLPTALSIALIAGGIIYGFIEKRPPPPAWNAPSFVENPSQATTTEKKKGKKKKGAKTDETTTQKPAPEPTPNVVAFPAVVPGGLEAVTDTVATETAPKPKAKKKKAKKAGGGTGGVGGGNRAVPLDAQSESSATAPESSTPVSRPTRRKSPPVVDADGPWTRVESKKRHETQAIPSDAGITTSVTGTSSPPTEPTEDEQPLDTDAHRRTLAEKLLPKARKTGVEDMLQTPDVPTLSRVMRVQPRPDEQPAAGFSWGDYEDVDESRATADDADGEDEGGWVTKSSRKQTRPKPVTQPAQSVPETLSKKQRQNLAKREAQKAAKADAEADRLATLAKHKRELEKLRIKEQSASNKKEGGGMMSSVNEKGQLVWD
ncbi:hypothetical protein BDY19DRAFT_1043990 [Irpex rosettiformis]|uniref:Uncharacterized protein n=1 Tax=Irpex rosettiformis TaxID=378272 RepID=A0ACB8TN94_9APHY|nr:hypothetical protein BDY19DRAFT_1043990 [Irpex rosettiformis]